MNDETFMAVYHAHRDLVYRSVLRKTHNEELANDICQQTFLKYFEYMHTVEPGFEKAWLLTVSGNMLIDYYRKHKVLTVEDAQLEEAGQEKCYEVDLAQEFIRKNFLSQILYELEQRNKDWYEALYQVCILNLPEKDVAEKLNISIDLLRTRIYRGRQYLKKLFGEEYRDL